MMKHDMFRHHSVAARRWASRGTILGGLLIAGGLAAAPGAAQTAVDPEEEETGIGSIRSSLPDAVSRTKEAAAAARGFALSSGAVAFVGSDDNVYRSPRDLEHGGRQWGNWVFVQTDKRWSEGTRLLSNLTWTQTETRHHANVNSQYGAFSSAGSLRLGGGVRLLFDGDASHRNDDAARIDGRDYLRDYSYWRHGADAGLSWRLSEHHRIGAGGGVVRRDYAETATLESIDWNQWSIYGEYRLRFAPYHYLTLRHERAERRYRREPSSDQSGAEPADAPPEHHRFTSTTAVYTLPMGSAARLEASYAAEAKTDLFQDYESHRTRTLEVSGAVSAGRRFESRLAVSSARRRYANIAGDGGERLRYSLRQVELGVRFRVIDPAWLFGTMGHYRRDTNLTSGPSYRDYEGAASSFGLGLFF